MKKLPTVDIKGKEYVMVKDRVMALRDEHPDWSIMTDIVHLEEGMVIFKAAVADENGRIIGTGHAYEREGSTQINRTSYIENAETSAIGRAIAAACAIGIETSYGSANEVANAILQQEAMGELATDAEKATFRAMCGKAGLKASDVLKEVGWTGGMMTKAQHGQALGWLKEKGYI